MSFSAHKTYGPKGIGALYVRRKPRVRIEAQMHGGGHERGMRSGTLPTHQIVGMGEAFRIAKRRNGQRNARIKALRDRLSNRPAGHGRGVRQRRHDHRVPHNLNVSFNYVEGESLIMALKDIAVSSGSACTSASLEPSYVLRALGRNDELAHSSIRFTFGRFTTEEEIDYAVELTRRKVDKLRELSPLWDMYKDGVDINRSSGRPTKPYRQFKEHHHGILGKGHRPLRKPAQRRQASKRATTRSAPAWSARRPAAT